MSQNPRRPRASGSRAEPGIINHYAQNPRGEWAGWGLGSPSSDQIVGLRNHAILSLLHRITADREFRLIEAFSPCLRPRWIDEASLVGIRQPLNPHRTGPPTFPSAKTLYCMNAPPLFGVEGCQKALDSRLASCAHAVGADPALEWLIWRGISSPFFEFSG